MRIITEDTLFWPFSESFGQIMFVIGQHICLKFICWYFLGCSNQKFEVNLLDIFSQDILVNEMTILKSIFQEVDTFQHFLAFLWWKWSNNILSTSSLQENIDNHPVCLMLCLLIWWIICCQMQEFKNIARINILAQFLNQLLLRSV